MQIAYRSPRRDEAASDGFELRSIRSSTARRAHHPQSCTRSQWAAAFVENLGFRGWDRGDRDATRRHISNICCWSWPEREDLHDRVASSLSPSPAPSGPSRRFYSPNLSPGEELGFHCTVHAGYRSGEVWSDRLPVPAPLGHAVAAGKRRARAADRQDRSRSVPHLHCIPSRGPTGRHPSGILSLAFAARSADNPPYRHYPGRRISASPSTSQFER